MWEISRAVLRREWGNPTAMAWWDRDPPETTPGSLQAQNQQLSPPGDTSAAGPSSLHPWNLSVLHPKFWEPFLGCSSGPWEQHGLGVQLTRRRTMECFGVEGPQSPSRIQQKPAEVQTFALSALPWYPAPSQGQEQLWRGRTRGRAARCRALHPLMLP